MMIFAGSSQTKRRVFQPSAGLGFLLLLILFASCNAPPPPLPADIQCTTRSSNPVALTMDYSSEQEAWINDVVADFNHQQKTACDGPITVTATPTGSGESMQQILDGIIKPDIWSPSGSIWLALMSKEWYQKYHTNLISTGARDTPPLVISPVVIAMWRPEAVALGWPNKPIGWSDLASLSTNPRGWAAYGHPEWGAFKFSHTLPNLSNSGLDAVIAENYAGSQESQGLTLADVNNPRTQAFVANVESSIIYYGDDSSTSSGFLAGAMFCHDLHYLSAAVMYENLIVEGNDGNLKLQGKACPRPAPTDQVVAIYPKEGTLYSDHPFVIPQASWITPAKKAAAIVFRDFLLAPTQQQKALHYGFRPSSRAVAVGSPINSDHGVDSQQPQVVLQIPPVDVVGAVQANWQKQRKRLDVMLIMDRSGSMNETVNGVSKIAAAKQGLVQFVNLLNDLDKLGLMTFSHIAELLTPVSFLGPKRQQVLALINRIVVSGNTRLYDTIDEQWHALQNLPPTFIKVLIVLTDGLDNQSRLTEGQLVDNLKQSSSNGGPARIFTLAYGQDADRNALIAIADATSGQEFDGTPQNIQQLYTQIRQSV
jgi:Ca-activated chloride channel homolog